MLLHGSRDLSLDGVTGPRKETKHIVGFVACSTWWSLVTKSDDDALGGLATQHHVRCVARHLIFWRIQDSSCRGQSGRVACKDHRARALPRSSTQSDAACQRCLGMRACGAPYLVLVEKDNDALRLAVARGSAGELGHLCVHAETSFQISCSIFQSTLHKSSHRLKMKPMSWPRSFHRHGAANSARWIVALDAVPVAKRL